MTVASTSRTQRGAGIEPEEREHLLDALAGLIAARGWEHFVRAPIVLPTPRFFPDPWTPDADGVWCLAKRMLRFADLGALDVSLELFADGSAQDPSGLVHSTRHTDAAAWFAGIHDGVCYFGTNVAQLEDGLGVAAAMGHEAAHAYRRTHGLEIDDGPTEEQLTDLTAVYLGFGVLGANAASRHRSWNPGGDVFASVSTHQSLGYLSPQAMCFLLACQVAARGEAVHLEQDTERDAEREIERALETNQAAYYRRARAWLAESVGHVRARLGVPEPSRWPPPVDLAPLLRPIVPPAPQTDEHPARIEATGLTASRVPTSRALALGIVGGMVGGALGLFGLVASGLGEPGWLLVTGLAGLVGGAVLGHRRPDWHCSRCGMRLRRTDPSCPACRSRITHDLRRAADRLDDDAPGDAPPELEDGSIDASQLDASQLDGSALVRHHGVLCVSTEGDRVGRLEFDGLQRRLDLVFPTSYMDYLATLGAGIDSDRVEIWSPQRIAAERPAAAQWLAAATWDSADDLVDLDPHLLVLIGTTTDGDRLAMHPALAKHVLWLRADVREIVDLGVDFHAALDTLCDLPADQQRWFAPPSLAPRGEVELDATTELDAIVERILEFGPVRLQRDHDDDGTPPAWLVLVPGIGGTVRIDPTAKGAWSVEVASDAGNTDAARRLLASLST